MRQIGRSMNQTGDLLLCSCWTTFQYTTKADDDSGLAVVFKLLYMNKSIAPVNTAAALRGKFAKVAVNAA